MPTPSHSPSPSQSSGAHVIREASATLKVGIPIILAQLMQMSMNFVDTVMAGRLSALDLAAVAIGSSMLLPFLVFGLGTLMAVNPIVAQNYGSRRFDLIGSNMRQTLWISQMIALPFFFFVRNLDFLMVWIGVTGEVIPVANGYLQAISWGIFPVMAYGAFRYFNEGLSVTRPGMYIALLGTLANIPLNYILMYGNFGFPRLGAVGTGYASAVVYMLMFLAMLTFTYNFKPYRRFDIFGKFRLPDKNHFNEMLSLGVPIGVSVTMEVSLFAIVSLLMGTLGTIAVAGHQIAINFAAMTFMVPFGLSMAITARVGQSAGKGRIDMARFRGFVGVGLCTIFMFFTAVTMILLPEYIVAIYTSDPDVADMAVQLLFMAAIFQVSDGLQVGGFGALRGLKDTKKPMYVNIFSYIGIGLTLAWYLGIFLDHGPIGLWTGLIVGLTVAAIMHNVRFYYKTR
ncbi:MAG: MATE family efflux transporter [Balneolaceae bacterium]